MPARVCAVSAGGQLRGIELPSAEATYLCVYDTSDSQGSSQFGCTQTPPLDLGSRSLSAGEVQGAYFDVSALRLPVSAGQTLRFQVGGSATLGTAYSGDVVAGHCAGAWAGGGCRKHLRDLRDHAVCAGELADPLADRANGGRAALWNAGRARSRDGANLSVLGCARSGARAGCASPDA